MIRGSIHSLVFMVLHVFICLININAQDLKDLVPSEKELKDYRFTEKPEWYHPDNLWDYMNGGAPGYLAYGFQGLVTFIVQNTRIDQEVAVDVYDMGESQSAFGIFSVERPLTDAALEVSDHLYRSENSLYFWQAKYYVKLMAYDILPETANSLKRLAEIIRLKIPRDGEIPRSFSAFPKTGRLTHTERYIAQGVLGQDFLKRGYSVVYKKENIRYQMFWISGEEPRESRENFERFYDYIKTVGKITVADMSEESPFFASTGSHFGTTAFKQQDWNILGIIGEVDSDYARVIIKEMLKRLERN